MIKRNARLNKENEDQELKIREQEKKMHEQEQTISALNVELAKLRTENKDDDLSALVRLADGKVDLGLKRQKAVVECSIGGMNAFINASTSKILRSEYFFCDGLAWSVEACIQTRKGVRYLLVYLRATNPANDNADLSSQVSYNITLLNSNPLLNTSIRVTYRFSKDSLSWGWHEFITIDDLCSTGFLQPSYLKNDEIKFWVDLSVKKIAPPSSSLQENDQNRFLYELEVIKQVLFIICLILFLIIFPANFAKAV